MAKEQLNSVRSGGDGDLVVELAGREASIDALIYKNGDAPVHTLRS